MKMNQICVHSVLWLELLHKFEVQEVACLNHNFAAYILKETEKALWNTRKLKKYKKKMKTWKEMWRHFVFKKINKNKQWKK